MFIHYTNEQYWLTIIYRAGDTLIYIVLSKILMKHLLKQKDKKKSIKIGVYNIHWLRPRPDIIQNHMTITLVNN